MQSNPASNGTPGVPCQCIIAHPYRPEFLIVRHSTGWGAPTLYLPEGGMLPYRPDFINQGMMNKYRMRTTVLRQRVSAPDYVCFEMEMHPTDDSRAAQIAWVGMEQYDKVRPRRKGSKDAFRDWLEERQTGKTPSARSPWETSGWFADAEKWIEGQLKSLGMEQTGPVEQFKAGWPEASLLRTPSAEGFVYFKASWKKPPEEARLTVALAQRWPRLVTPPLAADTGQNWLLMPDFGVRRDRLVPAARFPDFSARLAGFQLETAGDLDTWRELGCPDLGLPVLQAADGRIASLLDSTTPLLSQGKGALRKEERRSFLKSFAAKRADMAELESFGIPDTLAHLDFRPDNFFEFGEDCRIMDWSDIAITHPFFSMAFLLKFLARHGTGYPGFPGAEKVDSNAAGEIARRYLEEFTDLLSMDRLQRALALAQGIWPLVEFLNLADKCNYLETGSLRHSMLTSMLKARAREIRSQGS